MRCSGLWQFGLTVNVHGITEAACVITCRIKGATRVGHILSARLSSIVFAVLAF